MSNLQIVKKNGQYTTDSRMVAEMIGKRHDHLIRDIKGYCDILSTAPNVGVSDFFIESSYQDSTGRTLPCYDITRKGCDMVANKMTGEKGVLFTAEYVTAFEQMEKQLTSPYQLPQTYSEALRLAADQAEKIDAQAKQIEAAKPLVRFAESVQDSDGTVLVGELAKIIKQNGVDLGQNRLFGWMRNNGFLICRKGTDYNMPTQRSMELGLFTIKETVINQPDGIVRISKTPKVTGKGQVYFVNKFVPAGAE